MVWTRPRETARQDLLGLEARRLLRELRLGKGFVWQPVDDLPRKL